MDDVVERVPSTDSKSGENEKGAGSWKVRVVKAHCINPEKHSARSRQTNLISLELRLYTHDMGQDLRCNIARTIGHAHR